MESHRNDMSSVCQKLKRGRNSYQNEKRIPFIETLCGVFEGQNDLEQIRNCCVINNTKTYQKIMISMKLLKR